MDVVPCLCVLSFLLGAIVVGYGLYGHILLFRNIG